MSNIEGHKVSLGKLFGESFFFSIPDYQRPYSWTAKNCEQLLEDINLSSRDKEYFLGTVILQAVAKVGNGYKYDIIDGQQRITTLQILLAVMRDLYQTEQYISNIQKCIYQQADVLQDVPERVRLEVIDKSFFKKYFQTHGKALLISPDDATNTSQELMVKAALFFRDHLSSFSQAKLEDLGRFLLQRCVAIYVSTDSFEDAYRLFIVVNDRGMQLRRIDILKAQNLDPAIIRNESDRKEYAKKWQELEKDLGSDSFEQLFSHIRAIEIKEKASGDLLSEYTNQIFGYRIEKGCEFIDHIEIYKLIYEKLLLDGDAFLGEKQSRVEFNNLVRIMIDYLPSNEWIPPLLSYYKKFKEVDLLSFLKRLEAKFVGDWVNGLTLTKRNTAIYLILKTIEASSSASTVLSSKTLDFDSLSFGGHLGVSDFYDQAYSKYMLAKLDYLIGESNSERRIIASSIEHVLPQHPAPNSKWMEAFSADDRRRWTNHVANLVLLSKRKNASASNLDFDKKKEKYLKDRITDLPSSIEVINCAEWTPRSLAERADKILKLLTS